MIPLDFYIFIRLIFLLSVGVKICVKALEEESKMTENFGTRIDFPGHRTLWLRIKIEKRDIRWIMYKALTNGVE